ncbi:MAG TPA: hypothetical protein VHC69_13255 [Polyangiaceae bacterium]|nr:hypothetical protein [Polyangiaceae bacterium]
MRRSRPVPLLLALAVSCCWARSGLAQTLPDPDIDCAALPDPKVFIEAGDTQMTFLGDLARQLRDAADPITLVYLPRSTCTLADNHFNARPTTETMRYVPSISESPTWNGTPHQCNNRAGGFLMDLGIGATFISSCSQTIQSEQPSDTDIVPGPILGYGFVVPDGSLDAASGGITWDEAYYVFSGMGQSVNAVPWTAEPNPATGTPSVYIRNATASTLLTCAANVDPTKLPASSWVGYRKSGQDDRSSVVVSGVENAPPGLRDATIGILGVDLYDQNRQNLDILAFQGPGQKYGYYPDSTPSLKDKRNVRDGHYLPWAYTEYLVKVDSSHAPTNPLVARLIDLVQGDKETHVVSKAGVSPAFDLDSVQIVARNGMVPDCAMQVSRKIDGGDFSLYSPSAPCGCSFEAAAEPSLKTDPKWSARCTTCTSDASCGSGKCRHGYCEAK